MNNHLSANGIYNRLGLLIYGAIRRNAGSVTATDELLEDILAHLRRYSSVENSPDWEQELGRIESRIESALEREKGSALVTRGQLAAMIADAPKRYKDRERVDGMITYPHWLAARILALFPEVKRLDAENTALRGALSDIRAGLPGAMERVFHLPSCEHEKAALCAQIEHLEAENARLREAVNSCLLPTGPNLCHDGMSGPRREELERKLAEAERALRGLLDASPPGCRCQACLNVRAIWCGRHRVEISDWLDNPQCPAVVVMRALAELDAP